jgi:hypothetical protein
VDSYNNSDIAELADVLDGLIPLQLMRWHAQPLELARARGEAATPGGIADIITESGDRLTAPGNFRDASERRVRGDTLAALAAGIALGALEPEGVHWGGRHWCVAAHADCPNRGA